MFNFFEVNTIRGRMVSSFLFLSILIIILAVVSVLIFNHITRITKLNREIHLLEINTLSLIYNDNDFINIETSSPAYFEKHSSFYLDQRNRLNKSIQQQLFRLRYEQSAQLVTLKASVLQIDTLIKSYNSRFEFLKTLIDRRGFKDFGLEGSMRHHAHQLETHCSPVALSDLLYLRRHEKDFILRHDIQYVQLFNERSKLLYQQVPPTSIAAKHLEQYNVLFNELVIIEQQIGLNNKSGLKHELNQLTAALQAVYNSLSRFSENQLEDTFDQSRKFFIIITISALVFAVLSGYWMSKSLSEPITRLSKLVNDTLVTKMRLAPDFSLRNAATEINILTGSFIQLINQARLQVDEIKQKSRLLKRKNKQLKKVNKELDLFLYSAAHDLRSPLTSLLGLINVIRYENKQPELHTYFEMMENSIQRLERFISQIVNFSQNKRTEIRAERINLQVLINEVFENHQFLKGYNQLERIVNIQEDLPFYSDQSRFTIIFNNLISNAIKYIDFEKSRYKIQIRILISATHAHIEFADNGQGIAPEHLKNIFEMFYRANLQSSGSGLGLFLFKETINRLKGEVLVESTEGKGTTFYIILPNLYHEVKSNEKLSWVVDTSGSLVRS